MTYHLSILFFLAPILLFSQIGREFNVAKVDGGVTQSTDFSYTDVVLDQNGMPILPDSAENESLHFYQDGYLIETRYFEYVDQYKELSSRVLLEREEAAVKKADIYYFRQDKESLLRSHEAVIKDGKVFSEKIRNERKEIASADYLYGTTDDGLDFKIIDLTSQNRTVRYHTESDSLGVVSSIQCVGLDTSVFLKRLEAHGDTLSKSLLVRKNARSNTIDSILITVRNWLDANGNPTMILTQMDALTEPPEGEPKSGNFVTVTTYGYNKIPANKASNTPSQQILYGAWIDESNNIELFFEPENNNNPGEQKFFGSSYRLKSDESTPDQYFENGEIWIYILKQPLTTGAWVLNENGELSITLNGGSVLLFSAKMDLNSLILTPTMNKMKGALRLTKSK